MSASISRGVYILLLIAFAHVPAYGQSVPHAFVVEGRLYNQDGTPLSDTNTDVSLELVSESNLSCVLYREIHSSVNFNNASDPSAVGVFSLELGSGTPSPGPKPSFVTLFSPGAFTGVGGCSVTATAGQHRYVRIGISNALNGNVYEYFPLALISSVPSAVVADSASSLQGLGTSSFVQTNGASLTQSNVANIFSSTNYPRLEALLSGTSSQYLLSTPTSAVNFNNQQLVNVATPATGAAGLTNAVNRAYADGKIAGYAVDPTIGAQIGVGIGLGKVMVWDSVMNRWTAGDAADPTKLPLAGGTMTGAINMNAQNITNAGFITMGTQKYLGLGRYTDTEETALIATPLTAAHAGVSWYNTTSKTYKIWDGSAAIPQAWLNAGKLDTAWLPSTTVTAGTYGSQTQIPVVTIGADGRITSAYGTSFTGGGSPTGTAGGDLSGTYPNPNIANLAVTTAKIADGAITAAKIKTGYAINRLIATDPVTPNNLTYFECADPGQIMAWSAGSGWSCTTVGALAPVKTVAGKSPDAGGNISLAAYDINGIESAATKDFGTAAGDLVELDGTGKIPFGVLPTGIGTVNTITAQSPLTGGGTGSNITIGVDTGTGANQVVRVNGSGILPALEGSLLTNVNAAKIGGRTVASSTPATAQVLAWNGSQWEPTNASGGSVSAVTAGTGLTGGTITGNGTLSVDVGSTAGKIVQVDGLGRLPPIDATNLFNIDAANLRGYPVTATAPTAGNTLRFSGSQWDVVADSTGTVTNVTAGTGLTGGAITTGGTLNVDVGTAPLKIVQFDASTRYPAADGSQITAVSAVALRGQAVSALTPSTSQILTWNGSAWEAANAPAGGTGTVTSVTAGSGLTGGPVTGNGTLAVDVGTGVGKIPQLAIAGQMQLTNGVVGTPAYSFAGDTNTGMYHPTGTDRLALATNGTSRIYIDNIGQVGIGTNTPASLLDLAQTIDGSAGIQITNNNGAGASSMAETAYNVNGAGGFRVGLGGVSYGIPEFANRGYAMSTASGITLSAWQNGGDIRMHTGGSNIERMRVTDNGVGIGDTAPNVALSVNATGTASAILIPRDSTANRPVSNAVSGMIRYNTTSNKFEFYENGAWVNYGTGGATSITLGLGLLGGPVSSNGTITIDAGTGANQIPRLTAGGQIQLNGGSAATPPYTFNGDTNTGMFRGATADYLNFSTDGSPRVTIDNLGNVGVGTTSPSNLFEVSGNINDTIAAQITNLNSAGGQATAELRFQSSPSAGVRSSIGRGGVNNANLFARNRFSLFDEGGGISLAAQNGDVRVYTAAGIIERARFTDIGLGLGDTNPSVALSVNATGTASAILIPRDSTGNRPIANVQAGMIRYNTTDNKFEFYENGAWVNYSAAGAGGDFRADGTVAMSGALRAAAGNVSNPGLTFAGDTDTGIYSPAANTVALATSGAARITIQPAGNVGIGTDLPQAALEITGTGDSSSVIIPRDSTLNRPSTGVGGMMRFNTTTNAFEVHNGSGWRNLSVGDYIPATGGTTTGTLYVGYGTATAALNVSGAITATQNIMALGNIIASGGKVTEVVRLEGSGTAALQLVAGGTNSLDLSSAGSFVRIVSSQGFRNEVITDVSDYNTASAVFAGGVAIQKSLWAKQVVTPALYGTTAAGGSLTIDSTTSATKGTVNIIPSGGNLDIADSGSATVLIIPYGTGRVSIGGAASGSTTLQVYHTSSQMLEMNGSAPFNFTGRHNAARLSVMANNMTTSSTANLTGLESTATFFNVGGNGGYATGITGNYRFGASTSGYYTSGGAGVLGAAYQTSPAAIGEMSGVHGSSAAMSAGSITGAINGVKAETTLQQVSSPSIVSANALRAVLTGNSTSGTVSSAAIGRFEFYGTAPNITNLYGVYVGAMPVATNSWAFYQPSSSDKNYFGGRVGIGTPNPSVALEVNGTGALSAIVVPRDSTANRPITVANGMLRYNTSTSKFEAYENGSWKDLIQSPRNTVDTFEEFLSPPIVATGATLVSGPYMFTSSGGPTLAPASPSAGDVGLARIQISTVATQSAVLGFCGANAAAGSITPTIALGANPWVFEARVKVSSVGNANQWLRVGLLNANSATDSVNSGLYVMMGPGSSVFSSYAANGSAATFGASSSTVSTTSFYTVKIVSDGSTYTYFVNGSQLTTPSASIPATGTAVCAGVFAGNSAGTTTVRSVDVDYISFTQQFMGR